MRKLILIFSLSCLYVLTQAQQGTWTWVGGDSLGNNMGNYGVKGVASSTNWPAARYQANYWTDTSGNLWMMGGSTFIGDMNDLWKLDISTGLWTWMRGDSTAYSSGNFGVQGVSSPINEPPYKSYGSNCWTDKNNNLWLYSGYTSRDDLWKYSIATNEWTFMKGSTVSGLSAYVPVYGQRGVEDINNTPGNLTECKAAYVNDNYLYFFGGAVGNGYESNSMWAYNMNTNNWVWLRGDTDINNQMFNYGIKGTEDSSVMPLKRINYTRWQDLNNNPIVLGGVSNQSANLLLNDVFRFNLQNNNWTWVSGQEDYIPDNLIGSLTYCIPDSIVAPRKTYEYSTAQSNDCNRTGWLFGGSTLTDLVNSLWAFNPSNNTWTLCSGNPDTVQGSTRGTLGVPSILNSPGSRCGTAIWTDKNNNLWVFGGFGVDTFVTGIGFGSNYLSDLWKYTPDFACVGSANIGFYTFALGDTIICSGEETFAVIKNAISYDITPSQTTLEVGDSLFLFPTQTTTYTLTILDGCGKTTNKVFTIFVGNPNADFTFTPAVLNLNESNSPLIQNLSSNTSTYQWYENSSFLSSNFVPQINIPFAGNYTYTLVACDNFGCCDTTEKTIEAIIKPLENIFIPNSFSPNNDGVNDNFSIQSKGLSNFNVSIYDRWGNKLFESFDKQFKWDGKYKGVACEIGTYFYLITYGNLKDSAIKTVKGDILLMR